MPVPDSEEPAQALRAAYADPATSLPAVREAALGLTAAAQGASERAAEAAALSLAPLLSDGQPDRRAELALALGVLVERGCPPGAVGPSIVAACKEALLLAARFFAVLARRAEAELPDDWEPDEGEEAVELGTFSVPKTLVDAVAGVLPVEAGAFASLERFCLPAIACLTRDATLRAAARADEELLRASAPLAREAAHLLDRLLRAAADEAWIVLHPGSRRGWRVRMREVPDNFTLHTLLAAVLPPDLVAAAPSSALVAHLRGEAPLERDARGRGSFALYTSKAIGPGGRLRAEVPLEDWVWNEGIPADVPRLDGVPVLVVGPATIERSWNAARTFAALASDVVLEAPLATEELTGWLERAAPAAP